MHTGNTAIENTLNNEQMWIKISRNRVFFYCKLLPKLLETLLSVANTKLGQLKIELCFSRFFIHVFFALVFFDCHVSGVLLHLQIVHKIYFLSYKFLQ